MSSNGKEKAVAVEQQAGNASLLGQDIFLTSFTVKCIFYIFILTNIYSFTG
jgi:hypothetical protein